MHMCIYIYVYVYMYMCVYICIYVYMYNFQQVVVDPADSHRVRRGRAHGPGGTHHSDVVL